MTLNERAFDFSISVIGRERKLGLISLAKQFLSEITLIPMVKFLINFSVETKHPQIQFFNVNFGMLNDTSK